MIKKKQFILEIEDMNNFMIKQDYIKKKIMKINKEENNTKKDMKKIENRKIIRSLLVYFLINYYGEKHALFVYLNIVQKENISS